MNEKGLSQQGCAVRLNSLIDEARCRLIVLHDERPQDAWNDLLELRDDQLIVYLVEKGIQEALVM